MPRTYDLRFGFGGTPPPPSSNILYGTSYGLSAAVTKAAMPACKAYRTYTPGQLGSLPAGALVNHSIRPTVSFADTNDPNYANQVATLRSGFGAIPDVAPGQYPFHLVTVHHEPEGDGITNQQWVNYQVNLRNDVVNFLNATRVFPLKIVATLQGITFTGTNGGPASWFTPQCLAVLDYIGSDVYQSANWLATEQFAIANGNFPWIIPEHGNTLGNNGTPDTGSTGMLTRMQNNVGLSATEAWPPAIDFWFNNAYNSVVAPLNSALAVGGTSLTMNQTAIPSGSTITMEPGTVRQESLTVGQYTGGPPEGAGATPCVYPITTVGGAKFAHALNSTILTHPQSYAYWNARF